MLPRDPAILLSVVNTHLRDRYPSLQALCDDLDESEAELCDRLAVLGYHYDPSVNRFL